MLLKKKYFLLILLYCASILAHAQINKANRLFEQEIYAQAAALYEQVLENDSSNQEAITNLAHSYRHEQRFSEALELFKKSQQLSEQKADNQYYLAEMHFRLRNFDQAVTLLKNYLESAPEDSLANHLLKQVEQVRQFPVNSDFNVVSLEGINSPYADFSPVVYNAGLVFTTERKTASGNTERNNEIQPFLDIYYAPSTNKRKTAFLEAEVFSSDLSTRYHDGPAAFDEAGKTFYFTRVEREFVRPAKINTMKIFVSHFEDPKWSEPMPFPHNSNEYSVAHPAAFARDSALIFSSDMPGGHGGMDLYISYQKSGNWSEPKNMGPAVNSSGNEVFPHVFNETLYFSSNGWPGYGGLDLFSVPIDSLEQGPLNLYAPINSGWDDLSLIFHHEHLAYFASNRPGGLGRDDIYALERKVPEDTFQEISGVLEYKDKPAAHTSLLLKDEQGEVLQRTVTDESGSFALKYLKSETEYSLALDIAEKDRLKNFTLYFLNSQQEKVQRVTPSADGDFKFELLPPDDHDNLELLEVEDASLLSIDISGQVFHETRGDFSDRIEIQIYNADGELLSRTFTKNDGIFIFRHLFPDDQYIFRMLPDDPSLNLVIIDDQGNELARLSRVGQEYIFDRFAPGDPVLKLLNEKNITIRISPDDKFAIPNIYYDLDSWQLNDKAQTQLDKLVVILEKNPETAVHVMSHTDSRASDQYNLKLSEKRAAEVTRYLKQKGIEPARLSGKGYGEKQLVNHCKNEVPCPESEHAKNRRTEFTLK